MFMLFVGITVTNYHCESIKVILALLIDKARLKSATSS